MVRTYKRKTNKGSYGIEALKNAINDVVQGKMSKIKGMQSSYMEFLKKRSQGTLEDK